VIRDTHGITSIARALVANAGVKLLALLVAIVIWFNAIGQQEDEQTFVVPLQFVGLADTLTVTGACRRMLRSR